MKASASTLFSSLAMALALSSTLSLSPTSTSALVPTEEAGTPDPPKNDLRLAAGAVAGVAIGSWFAGLLIGILCTRLVQRDAEGHVQQRSRLSFSIGGSTFPKESKDSDSVAPEPIEPVEPLEPIGPKIDLEQLILHPALDKDILGKLESLEDTIESHVERCYHLKPVDIDKATLARALARLGIDEMTSGFDPQVVAHWCLEPLFRRVALQHIITHIVFASIDSNSRHPLSMLPESMASFARAIRPVSQYSENRQAMTFALNRWRTLSALLLHASPNERTPLVPLQPEIRHHAETMAEAMGTVLDHFVDTDPYSQRTQRSHVLSTLMDSARFGYTLFSHPSDWRFVYRNELLGRGVAVCVGLERMSHPDGRRIKPQRMVDPRMIYLDQEY